MNENYRPATLAEEAEINKVPKPLRKVSSEGPKAGEVYTNVQVLGDLSKPEFARLMVSFKNWVAPEVGCNYCHNAPDYASDEKYPKLIARAMIGMTRHINSDWTAHVKTTGVTCYTCHRGQPVPPKVWYGVPQAEPATFMARKPSQRPPTPSAARTALPAEALGDFLLDELPIRIVGPTPLQDGNTHTVRQARSSYTLMMVMAESLGVNCTYCHNTRSFSSWDLSPPPRVTAWYGIRMARDLNRSYVGPLAGLLPPERLGPAGDGPKVYCATCHLGSSKPLNGARMAIDFPELVASKPYPTTGPLAAVPPLALPPGTNPSSAATPQSASTSANEPAATKAKTG
jgi:photosynthetic reaction center cytochrome c subunit